jgi:hypothetical protein
MPRMASPPPTLAETIARKPESGAKPKIIDEEVM